MRGRHARSSIGRSQGPHFFVAVVPDAFRRLLSHPNPASFIVLSVRTSEFLVQVEAADADEKRADMQLTTLVYVGAWTCYDD